jgi:SAM-dependent methyltransferase
MIATKSDAQAWRHFARDYTRKVFSPTSFETRRARILRDALPGVALDLGCGPLGLVLRDLARLPATQPIGSDFSAEMVTESRRQTAGLSPLYVVADHRCLPFRDGAMDSVIAVNSIVPSSPADADLIFGEGRRVLRKGGRLIALLPAFEMSIVARDRWRMKIRLDLENHREWDTSGWQTYHTLGDIEGLMKRHRFGSYQVDRVTFSEPAELTHIREIYAGALEGVPQERLVEMPLFEHLLMAER